MPSGAQQIELQLIASPDSDLSSVTVHLTRLGDESDIALTDDGATPGDTPFDGKYFAATEGPYAAIVRIALDVQTTHEAAPTRIYEGDIPLRDEARTLVAWRLTSTRQGLVAMRTAADWPFAAPLLEDGNVYLIGFGWMIVACLLVLFAIDARAPRGERP